MKINVVVGHAFPVPPVKGGHIEKMAYNIALVWAHEGHDVFFYSRQYNGLEKTEQPALNLTHIRVKGYDWCQNRWINLWNALRYAITITRTARAADVVYCHTFFYPLFAAAFQGKHMGVVSVLNREPKAHFLLYGLFVRMAPNAPLKFFAASDFIKKAMERRVKALKQRISVCYNAVNTKVYVPAPNGGLTETPTIVYAGRIAREKGLAILLDAYFAARADMPVAQLRVIGPLSADMGSDEIFVKELKAACKASPYGDEVLLTGFKPEHGLVPELQKAWVFCYPSYAGESFGASAVQAMACGTPVITTDFGPFPEVFTDGVEGFQVPVKHAGSLAEAITRIVIDKNLRAKMSRAALERAQCFCVDTIAHQYLEKASPA